MTMKKIVMALAVIGCLALVAGPAQATLMAVSVNMKWDAAGTLAAADVAGLVPMVNWNNHTIAATETISTGLVNSLGATTVAQVKVSGGNTMPNTNELQTGGPGPNWTMMYEGGRSITNYSGNHYVQVELAGLTAALDGKPYDLYIYFGTGYTGNFMGGPGTMWLSGPGVYTNVDTDLPASNFASLPYRSLNSNWTGSGGVPVFTGTFILSNGSTNGNYIMFPGLTQDVVCITPQVGIYSFGTTTILGVELVYEAPALPIAEPAGLGLLGVALLALKKRLL